MPRRLVSVDDTFNLPPAVKVADDNLPTHAKAATLAATYATTAALTPKLDKTEAATTYSKLPTRGAAPTTATVTKAYNPSLYAFNLKPSNTRKLRAALAASVLGTEQARIAMVGDSTTAGYTATVRPDNTRPVKFRNELVAAGYSVGGVVQPLNESSDPRWTYPVGTWAQWNPLSLFRSSTGVGSQAVFTSTNTGTVAEVTYNNNGGAFSVAIDGGTAVTVTPTGASALGVYQVTGLANTTHTITITLTAGSATYIQHASVRQATGGVIVGNFGISSSRIDDWNQPQFYAPGQVVASWKPHASIVCIEINDTTQSTVVATYKTKLQSVINTLKAAGDVILCTANPFSAGGGNISDYTKAIYELAETNDLAVIDITSVYGGTYAAATASSLMFDTLHPNNAGYALDGAAIGKALVTSLDTPGSV